MKRGMLLLLILSSVFVHAQSLKDALYGGKLKNDPGTAIRKGDDLTTKIDTTHKAVADEAGKTMIATPGLNSSAKRLVNQTDSAAVSKTDNKDPNTATGDTAVSAPKNNTVVWKEYIDSTIKTLITEVLPSKKVKPGTYYATVSYTIGVDGQVVISDVFLSPESAFLQQQIKERLTLDAPRLNPVLSGSGIARKVNKKYNFTLSKQ